MSTDAAYAMGWYYTRRGAGRDISFTYPRWYIRRPEEADDFEVAGPFGDQWESLADFERWIARVNGTEAYVRWLDFLRGRAA